MRRRVVPGLAWVLATALLGAPVLGQDLEGDLRRLDEAQDETFAAALEALESEGQAACRLALTDFETQPYLVRRARAQLFKRMAGAELLQAILPLSRDADPQVRRLVAEYLGELRLAAKEAPARLAALVRMAELDTQRFVRKAALVALKQAGLPGTSDALDGLLDRVDGEFGLGIARTLAALPQARLRLLERVQGAFDRDSDERLAAPILARLLEGYGSALAELPGGGRSARERGPLVLGVTHSSIEVQAAAVLARERCFQRLFALGEHTRSEQLMADLGADGLARHGLLYLGIKQALSGRGDWETGLKQAKMLVQASQLAPAKKRETFRVYGLHYSGVALFAGGDPAAASAYFELAAQASRGLLQERLDLRGPAPDRGNTRLRNSLGGRVMVERAQLYALDLFWLALSRLAQTGAADEQVFDWVRAGHIALLEARILSVQTDAGMDVSGIDSVFESDLSFEGLVLFNRKLEAWDPERAGVLLDLFGRVCATVMPWEFPGFEPLEVQNRRLTDPLFDGVRLELLRRSRSEEFYAIHRQLNRIQENYVLLGAAGDQDAESRQLRLQLRWLGMAEQEEASKRADQIAQGIDSPSPAQLVEAYAGLARMYTPSLLGLRMGLQLRVDGLPERARVRGEAVLADLGAGLPGANTVWVEWASARLEEMLGATYMDADRASKAEQIFLTAVRRLEALENTLKERGSPVGQVQRQRANVLLSLAVNANVRMQDAARALDFFERAFELDKRDFMQILRACYRARSGQIEEARGVLRTVTPTPQLYYNLACTYALLGDDDLALDYLQRDLEENHPVSGALRRQQIWSSEDPDLKSLWEHPRFLRLTATD